MNTEDNNQDGTLAENEGGEESEIAENQTDEESAEDVAKLQKQLDDYKSTISSLKRDVSSRDKKLNELKSALEPKETPEKTDQQSNEPDYAKLAFLKSNQVEHPDDQKAVLDEAARLKLPLTDVLQMEHIKSRIESQRNERETKEALPEGKGRKGGKGRGTVEYYLDNPDEQVPSDDLELANKVIEAKMKKEENKNMFSDTLYTG